MSVQPGAYELVVDDGDADETVDAEDGAEVGGDEDPEEEPLGQPQEPPPPDEWDEAVTVPVGTTSEHGGGDGDVVTVLCTTTVTDRAGALGGVASCSWRGATTPARVPGSRDDRVRSG